MSKLSAALGPTGIKRVVLGHTLNTQTLKLMSKKKVLSKFTILCWATFIAILGHTRPTGHRLDTLASKSLEYSAQKCLHLSGDLGHARQFMLTTSFMVGPFSYRYWCIFQRGWRLSSTSGHPTGTLCLCNRPPIKPWTPSPG